MKRKRVYVLFLLAISLLSVLLVRNWWNSSSPFVYGLRADIQSEIPTYEPGTSLFEFIANRRWILRGESSGEIWNFYGDGRFEYLSTDYTWDSEGTWRIVDFGNGQGLLYLSYTAISQNPNEDVNIWKKQISSIEAKNKHLNFNYFSFWGQELSATSKDPTMVIVDSAFIQKDFPAYSLLIRKRWIKDNDIYKDWMPHELTFFEDGTFYANYVRKVPCHFTGNWSISESKREGIDIRFFAPNARCNLRGGDDGYGTQVGYVVTDGNLINSYSTAYNYHAE